MRTSRRWRSSPTPCPRPRALDEVLARARAADDEVAAQRGRRTPARRTRTRSPASSREDRGRRRASDDADRSPRTSSTRTDRPRVSGLVVVDKPGGITSHGVVARVRRLAGTRKVGHAGTLDPMATGVLVLGDQPGHPAARPPDADREGLRRHDPARRLDHHRRRRGRGHLDRRPTTSPTRDVREELAAVRRRDRAGADRRLRDQGRRQAGVRASAGRRGGRAEGPTRHRSTSDVHRDGRWPEVGSRCAAPAAPTSARSPATSARRSAWAAT